jgi:hypothetical protein
MQTRKNTETERREIMDKGVEKVGTEKRSSEHRILENKKRRTHMRDK